MRVCVVGGGLAGSLLAWRLAREPSGWQIDLVAGRQRGADATAASGGAVRAYEPDPEQRRLAALSMAELLASPTLREWADFRRLDSVYVRRTGDGPADGLADELADEVQDLEPMLPDSAEVVTAADLERLGWADLDPDAVAVSERLAGHIAPGRLRDAVLADGPVRRRVSVLTGAVDGVRAGDDGGVRCVVAGRERDYDVVVLAAGAWTPALLRASGLPADGYRAKSIQYAVHLAGDWRPSQFVDEVTGLFGRPTPDGGLLLGLPTHLWEVDPDRPPTTPLLADAAARLARARFPSLRLGPAGPQVGSADCYADRPILTLRRASGADGRLFTFSGGAGGAAKTALAASSRAAVQLVDAVALAELTAAPRTEGH